MHVYMRVSMHTRVSYLGSADVGGGLVTANVLLACLHGHAQRAPPLCIHAHTDDAACMFARGTHNSGVKEHPC